MYREGHFLWTPPAHPAHWDDLNEPHHWSVRISACQCWSAEDYLVLTLSVSPYSHTILYIDIGYLQWSTEDYLVLTLSVSLYSHTILYIDIGYLQWSTEDYLVLTLSVSLYSHTILYIDIGYLQWSTEDYLVLTLPVSPYSDTILYIYIDIGYIRWEGLFLVYLVEIQVSFKAGFPVWMLFCLEDDGFFFLGHAICRSKNASFFPPIFGGLEFPLG